jgi:hypothetical protein
MDELPYESREAIYTFKIPPGKRRKATKVLTPHKKRKKTKRKKVFSEMLLLNINNK